MAYPKGRPNPNAGRPPGAVNKFTSSVKDAFAEAFDKMGGAEALLKWGKRNPDDFYKLASKLIPSDINAKMTGDIIVQVVKFCADEEDKL
jgi:hypothetical protein